MPHTHSHPGHDHDHPHDGHDHRAAVIAQAQAATVSPSLLGLSAVARMAAAGVLCLAIWAATFWAIG